MLTGKQKQYLKGTAVDFSAVVQIGKEGITDNVINQQCNRSTGCQRIN